MQISLKVTKVTSTDTSVVCKFEPSLLDARAGDVISGELFLSSAPENSLGLGTEVLIDFVEEVPVA